MNDEFIVYNPRQALPVYIIHLKKDGFKPVLQMQLNGSAFKKTRVLPKRLLDENDPYQGHFTLAEATFYRLQPNNTKYRVQSVDVVHNPTLEAKFTSKQAEFKAKGIPSNPVMGLHGTNATNIDSILQNNFDLAKVQRTAHGFGIYFSEQPEVSID